VTTFAKVVRQQQYRTGAFASVVTGAGAILHPMMDGVVAARVQMA